MGQPTASGPPKFEFINSETGELLGRTAGSWAKIGLFYIAYFSFLAGLFTASIQIMKTSINLEKPKLQTRLNIPGLHFFPKVDAESKDQTARLKENEGVPFYWDSAKEDSYKFYEKIVATEVEIYKNKSASIAANAVAGKNVDVVDFDWTTLGDCGVAPYGWDSSEPCIYLRLNRIIDWNPVGLFKPEGIFEEEGNLPTKKMVRDATYIRCNSKYIGDKEDGDQPDPLTFTYMGGAPSDGFVESKFFPYQGKSAQPDYQSPMVAVKVGGLTDGEKYRVKCHAFAKNIVIDDRDNLGSIRFEIQHGGTATKTE